ncbi:hypothetical protein [Nocardia cyriacigeorgica]|uniref:hypothetical protein n=1 Tax=Nocardia cyriacigeorgica TaxID=135487 RepID=UPI001E35C9E0|nr:hypothetical protein [Nocardia cyriacigeorgica]
MSSSLIVVTVALSVSGLGSLGADLLETIVPQRAPSIRVERAADRQARERRDRHSDRRDTHLLDHDEHMSDLKWDDVKSFFDPAVMGALPDIYVHDTNIEDWQAVFDLIRSSGWEWEFRVGDEVRPLPTAAEVLGRGDDEEVVSLHVRAAPELLAIFRPWFESQIEFDVDLQELQGQGGVDALAGFLGTIGRLLGKEVVMHAEGDVEHPVLGYTPVEDRVVVMAEPEG